MLVQHHARSVRHTVKQLLKLGETRPLLLGNSICLAVNVAELILAFVRPCVMSSALYAEECGSSMKVLLAKHRGWAAASSREVFQEIVQVTRQSQLQLVLFICLGALGPNAAFVASDLAAVHSPEYQQWFEDMCPGCSDVTTPVSIAWRWKATIAIIAASLSTYHNSIVLILRLEMWSPIFQEAAKKMNVIWLQRSLYTHCFQLVVAPLTVCVFAIAWKIKLMAATRAEMALFVWAALALVLIDIASIAWTLGLDVALFKAFSCRPDMLPLRHPEAEDGSEELLPTRTTRSTAVSTISSKPLHRVSTSGFKTRQLHILMNIILLMLGTPFGCWWTVA
eukprot:scaffold436484_cov36-Prasinocladus_malaysianus.AAC.1